jgi:hypothetical protein
MLVASMTEVQKERLGKPNVVMAICNFILAYALFVLLIWTWKEFVHGLHNYAYALAMLIVSSIGTLVFEPGCANEFRLKLRMLVICAMPSLQIYWSFFFATSFLSVEYDQHVTILLCYLYPIVI